CAGSPQARYSAAAAADASGALTDRSATPRHLDDESVGSSLRWLGGRSVAFAGTAQLVGHRTGSISPQRALGTKSLSGGFIRSPFGDDRSRRHLANKLGVNDERENPGGRCGACPRHRAGDRRTGYSSPELGLLQRLLPRLRLRASGELCAALRILRRLRWRALELPGRSTP